jgi:phosphatidylglycerol:prolipoprotein diacylglycerol transferase
MIPYLHLGPLQLPTFGLMVALALITAAYVLQADFDRRGMNADAFTMITVAGLVGIFGAKFYHLVDSEHLLDPEYRHLFFARLLPLLVSRYGFAWFGGFLGGFGALLVMRWRAKLSLWEFLDACSPAAAFGYGIGRIGCLLSGDGDYGIPTSLPWGMSFPKGLVPTTGIWDPESHSGVCFKYGLPENCAVHPTPLYELIVSCAIGWLLWRLGARLLKNPERAGEIFCYYLLLTGVERSLVEIIRINPPWILGMSNAQVASVVSVIAGCVLLWRLRLTRAPSQ